MRDSRNVDRLREASGAVQSFRLNRHARAGNIQLIARHNGAIPLIEKLHAAIRRFRDAGYFATTPQASLAPASPAGSVL